MKLEPKYSYEFNRILNESLDFTQKEQLQNFASLISDKDRFLALIPLLEKNSKFIEEKLGFKLPEKQEFYVVRAEKFKSFSEPVTIEYSLCPEEMLLFLLKEIIKISATRFPDETSRDETINSFIDYVAINGDWGKVDLVKFCKNLHDESKKLLEDYEFREIDFEKITVKDHLDNICDEIFK